MAGGAVRETFSKTNVLRRIHGIIVVNVRNIRNNAYNEACMDHAIKVPGVLILKIGNPLSVCPKVTGGA